MIEKIRECLCWPDPAALITTLLFFLTLFLIFFALLLFFRKVFVKESLGRKLVEVVRVPLSFLFSELALLSLAHLFTRESRVQDVLLHFFVILIIGTIGWTIAACAKITFRHFILQLQERSLVDISHRSALTQILFLYRLMMFLIFMITISTILVSFPYVKALGIGILSSAGIVGIAMGIAARPIFLNIMAGFQLAMTKTVKIGDAVFLEGDFCRIESMHLTHVVARTWDMRRIILPISYFIDKTFQNWDMQDPELIASFTFFCDFRMPIDVIRKKTESLLQETPLWSGKTVKVEIFDATERSLQIRIMASAKDAGAASDLKAYLREKIFEFLQKDYPDMLPFDRYRNYPEKD